MAASGGKAARTLLVEEEYEMAARRNKSRRDDVSEAAWITCKQVAVLHKPRGKILQTMGHLPTGGGATREWQLQPEEALFMVQQGILALREGDRDRVLSVAEVLDMVLRDGGISPFFFHAYAKIRDAGFVVARAAGDFHGMPLLHVWRPELSKKWRKSQPTFVMCVVRCRDRLTSSSCEEFERLQNRTDGCALRVAVVDDSFAVTFFDMQANGSSGNSE
eukprot:748956-Hanusia_phi.AAC.2